MLELLFIAVIVVGYRFFGSLGRDLHVFIIYRCLNKVIRKTIFGFNGNGITWKLLHLNGRNEIVNFRNSNIY